MSATLPSRPGESLHSLSWVFVLLAQLWNLFPLLFTIVLAGRLGKNDNWELAATLVAAVALSAYSMFYSYTFRFWVEDDEIIVKEGLFDRTLRHVPFNRIQNVAFRQNLLHRIFQVVELNLESGAGAKPEAKLTVLPQARARLLEQQIRRQRVPELAVAESSLPHTHANREIGVVELHRVPLRDLVRLGLISNRGMLLIGAAFYFLNQTKLFPTNMFKQIGLVVKDWIGVAHGPGFWIASGALRIQGRP